MILENSCMGTSCRSLQSPMTLFTSNVWSAPLDDVYLHVK